MTAGGCKPMARDIITGTKIWFSSCWTITNKAATDRATIGERLSPTKMAGIDAMIGPTTGTISNMAAINESGRA